MLEMLKMFYCFLNYAKHTWLGRCLHIAGLASCFAFSLFDFVKIGHISLRPY